MVAPDQDVWTSIGYVAAQNLTTNDWILNANTGSWGLVHSIVVLKGSFTMYDFTVNMNGNFIAWWNIMKDIISAC